MKLIRTNDYRNIRSNTCGALTELLNDSTIPISITKAINIVPTTKHAHKQSVEIYWVVEGNLEIELTTNRETKVIKLLQGTILIINPGEFHSVVKASETNEVIVLSTPPWTSDDELLD